MNAIDNSFVGLLSISIRPWRPSPPNCHSILYSIDFHTSELSLSVRFHLFFFVFHFIFFSFSIVFFFYSHAGKAVPFVELTVAHASVLTILAISFERYYAICEPLKAGYVCTKTRALMICLAAWAVAAIFTR